MFVQSCQSTNIGGNGLSAEEKTHYKCRNTECKRCTFILNYTHQGYLPEVKEKITDIAMNSGGIRDTARVLKVSQSTVINELKKESNLVFVNEKKASRTGTKSEYYKALAMGRRRSRTR